LTARPLSRIALNIRAAKVPLMIGRMTMASKNGTNKKSADVQKKDFQNLPPEEGVLVRDEEGNPLVVVRKARPDESFFGGGKGLIIPNVSEQKPKK